MIKPKLIELLKDKLSGSAAPSGIRGKYDNRVIELYLGMVYNDMIGVIYNEGAKGNNFEALDNFGKAYKTTVAYDSDREEYYTELPVQVVPLPENFGIRLVSPYKQQTESFTYRDNNAQHVWNKLHVDLVKETPSFYVELPRLYLQRILQGTENLMVKIIPPFSELTDTDEVFIPSGNNTMVFEKVYQLIAEMNKLPRIVGDPTQTKQVF